MDVKEFEQKEKKLIDIEKRLETIARSENISLKEVKELRDEALNVAKELDAFLNEFLTSK